MWEEQIVFGEIFRHTDEKKDDKLPIIALKILNTVNELILNLQKKERIPSCLILEH